VPELDLVDETFVVAAPAAVAAVVRDPDRWPVWWPDLRLSVFQDRGDAGVRWNVRGALTGSMEVWLEPCLDGVLLHHYMRCDRGDGRPVSRKDGHHLGEAVSRGRGSEHHDRGADQTEEEGPGPGQSVAAQELAAGQAGKQPRQQQQGQ